MEKYANKITKNAFSRKGTANAGETTSDAASAVRARRVCSVASNREGNTKRQETEAKKRAIDRNAGENPEVAV